MYTKTTRNNKVGVHDKYTHKVKNQTETTTISSLIVAYLFKFKWGMSCSGDQTCHLASTIYRCNLSELSLLCIYRIHSRQIYIHMYTYIHTYIHMYIHTHVHTLSHLLMEFWLNCPGFPWPVVECTLAQHHGAVVGHRRHYWASCVEPENKNTPKWGYNCTMAPRYTPIHARKGK